MSDDAPQTFEELDRELADLVAAGWPPALAKATFDCFWYAVGLRSGRVVVFRTAIPVGVDWVKLEGGDDAENSFAIVPPLQHHGLPFICDRGLEVRITDIEWAADAPFGS